MAGKDSYYRKHKEKINEGLSEASRKPAVEISASCRTQYELGKVLLIDKPVHWTSFDVVRKIRNSLRIKKVGHAGTLDPLATGLLIVCTGKFTKMINTYMAQEKEYTGTFTLGAVTPTYDLESTPVDHKDIGTVSTEQLQNIANTFVGTIQQVPPIYSAIKKQGTALYELARRGEAVVPEPRTVHIHSFEITEVNLPVVAFRITCGTGTYIRSMAHDYGAALGCGAYLSALRRTRIGDYRVENAVTVENFITALQEESTKGDV